MRVVSLVPSLTETVFDLGITPLGRTPWCIKPSNLVADVKVVGGTKTPNMNKIYSLKPDLVLLDKEENPKAVHDELLDEGIEVFVCTVEHPKDVPTMLQELSDKLEVDATKQILACEQALLDTEGRDSPSVIPLIWHDPLMAVSAEKYAGGMLTHLGFHVPTFDSPYPVITPETINERGIEYLLLSSEPHDFSMEEGELFASLCDPEPNCIKIDGEALTWFGTRTAEGLHILQEQLKAIR